MSGDENRRPGRPQDAAELTIQPGLTELPRQIGLFPAFRAAQLEDASTAIALSTAGWRGREVSDFGVMLFEMWAYVCDVLAFYDQFIAGESYLRTALRLAATRNLVGLIGYVPRPAVAAVADLAFTLSGRIPVSIPIGTQFRSGSFDDEKPQVFTLLTTAELHPLRTKFTLAPQRATTLGTGSGNITLNKLTFKRGSVTLKTDERALIRSDDASNYARRVKEVTDEEDEAANPVTRVRFTKNLTMNKATLVEEIAVERASQIADLFWMPGINDNTKTIKTYGFGANKKARIRLDGLFKTIRAGQYIILSRGDFDRWFKVVSATDVYMKITNKTTTTITNSDNTTSSFDNPAALKLVTRLDLDEKLNDSSRKASGDTNWTNDDAPEIKVYFGFVPGGALIGEAKATIGANDSLNVNERVETVDSAYQPEQFILRDFNEQGVGIEGALSTDRTLTVSEDSKWTGELTPPVTVYAAIARATRGEQVTGELLGVGNGSTPNQWFKLKKKPLTYLNAPSSSSPSGVESTLEIYVDGVKWKETPRFYGVASDATVYLVRENDDGEAVITFGDGVRGARLPSGAQVVANYYFGAGAVAPPAGSITQQVKPVKGVSTLTNPLPAFGGSEAEAETQMKTYAPRSALMLGRAVSLLDYEAVAAGTSSVRVARAEWAWSESQQRPVVMIWYIGDTSLGALIKERLQAVSAPGTPFDVQVAQAEAHTLDLTVLIDPDFIPDNVTAEAVASLSGEEGALVPEKLGIGATLFRSKLLELASRIEGVVAPISVNLDGVPFNAFGVKAGSGYYFEFTVTASATVAPPTIPGI